MFPQRFHPATRGLKGLLFQEVEHATETSAPIYEQRQTFFFCFFFQKRYLLTLSLCLQVKFVFQEGDLGGILTFRPH